ncbi:MAG: tyrosine-type recombinase/integrase, partial [Candidatus Limnocylindria bacterium]
MANRSTRRIVPEAAPAANARAAPTGLSIAEAADSYRRSLRAANRSPATIKTYLAGLDGFRRFLRERGMPLRLRAIRREHVEAYIVWLQDRGLKAATVSLAYRSLQPFFKWALAEDEIELSPMDRMSPPAVPEAPPPILREEQVRALLRACEGIDFEARRDTAIIRLLVDTGMRRGE